MNCKGQNEKKGQFYQNATKLAKWTKFRQNHYENVRQIQNGLKGIKIVKWQNKKSDV